MTSRTVTGKISRVNGKPFQDNKTGEDITLYSFQLEGSNQWFRTGQNPVPAGVGQSVKFVANGANVERGSIVTTQSEVTVAPAVTSAAAPSTKEPVRQNVVSKDDYWAAKEQRDIEREKRFELQDRPRMALSTAVTAAAQLVAVALQNDALSFGNAAKAKKVGLIAAFTKELALELAAFITNAPQELEAYKATTTTVASGSNVSTGEVQE